MTIKRRIITLPLLLLCGSSWSAASGGTGNGASQTTNSSGIILTNAKGEKEKIDAMKKKGTAINSSDITGSVMVASQIVSKPRLNAEGSSPASNLEVRGYAVRYLARGYNQNLDDGSKANEAWNPDDCRVYYMQEKLSLRGGIAPIKIFSSRGKSSEDKVNLQHKGDTYALYIGSASQGGGGASGNDLLQPGTIAIFMHKGFGIQFRVRIIDGYYFLELNRIVFGKNDEDEFQLNLKDTEAAKLIIRDALYNFGRFMYLTVGYGSGDLSRGYLEDLSLMIDEAFGDKFAEVEDKDTFVKSVQQGYADQYNSKPYAIRTAFSSLKGALIGNNTSAIWDFK